MRQIAFGSMSPLILSHTKTVTRRRGWRTLQPGAELQAVDTVLGFYQRRGTPPVKLAVLRVVAVRREPLLLITKPDVVREGYADLSPAQFVEMFCARYRCKPTDEVTRIAFAYHDDLERRDGCQL